MAQGMEDLTGDGGVLKKVMEHGVGPMVPEGAFVRVHYNGYLEYCDEPYDSSRLRGRDQQFRLGNGQCVWETLRLQHCIEWLCPGHSVVTFLVSQRSWLCSTNIRGPPLECLECHMETGRESFVVTPSCLAWVLYYSHWPSYSGPVIP